MNCPLEELKYRTKIPKSCQECFAEKQDLCDFPFVGKTNIYRIIDKYFEELKEIKTWK